MKKLWYLIPLLLLTLLAPAFAAPVAHETHAATGEAVAGLVSQVAPYDSTAVRYFVDPGAAGIAAGIKIALTFAVVTSNGQTLTDVLHATIV